MDISDSDFLAHTPLRDVMPSLWYPRMLPNTPSLLLLRRTGAMSRVQPVVGDPGPYHLVFVESDGDRRVVDEALENPIDVSNGIADFCKTIDRPNMRRSSFPPTGNLGVLLYGPKAEGWPWLILVMLPRNQVNMGYGRERYTWDAFDSKEEALDHLRMMTMV